MHLSIRIGFRPTQLVCGYTLDIELVNNQAQEQDWEFVHYIRCWDCGPKIASIELWKHKPTQQLVVWKECDQNAAAQGENELNLLSLFQAQKHPNLVNLTHAILDQDDMSVCYIGLEKYCERDLEWFLLHRKKSFTFEKSLNIFWQLVCGLRFIHKANIVHEDVCPRNVLVSDETLSHVALCDLGLAQLDDGTLVNEDCCGRYSFRAPEKIFTTKSDIYGLGVVARHLFYVNQNWFADQTELDAKVAAHCKENLEDAIRNGCRTFRQCWDQSLVAVLNWPPRWVRDLIERCVSENPQERPSCDDILDIISCNKTIYSNDWITCHFA